MKRWNKNSMLSIGKKLFSKVYKRKHHKNHNHDIHFLAREIEQWLPDGSNAFINGGYNPRCLKRYYFTSDMVDQRLSLIGYFNILCSSC